MRWVRREGGRSGHEQGSDDPANAEQGNRDADKSQLDFEEFRFAMIALRELLKIPEHESQLEDSCPVGNASPSLPL